MLNVAVSKNCSSSLHVKNILVSKPTAYNIYTCEQFSVFDRRKCEPKNANLFFLLDRNDRRFSRRFCIAGSGAAFGAGRRSTARKQRKKCFAPTL